MNEQEKHPSPQDPPEHYAFCNHHNYKPFTFYCKECGRFYCDDCLKHARGLPFCPECKHDLIPVSQLPPRRKKSVFMLLTLFFGFLGLQYFYLGSVATGLIVMFLSVFVCAYCLTIPTLFVEVYGIYLIIAGIALIVAAATKKEDTYGRPLM